jgi:hypothetical protein
MNIVGRPTIILGTLSWRIKKATFLGRTHYQDRIKKFPKILKPSQNSDHQMSDMKKILYQTSTNIRCQRTKFCHLSERTPENLHPCVWQHERHKHTHTHTHTQTYIYIYIYIYTHTHTHTHAFVHIHRVIQGLIL